MAENLEDMKKLVSEIVGESYSIGNITSDHLKFGMTLCRSEVESVKIVQETSLKLQKMLENLNENILPRPVIRDGNGKLTKDYWTRDWFVKLQEEIFEVMNAFRNWLDYHNDYGDDDPTTEASEYSFATEIAYVITVCISYLNAIGYDEKDRSELFARVNEKNEKRGYFKGAD